MRFLLDTQAFLWFTLNDDRLSKTARELMADTNNVLLISPAIYWEIAIKVSIGKYALPEPFETFMNDQIVLNQLTILPLSVRHADAIVSLPFHHRDPFDRMLIAQAICEDIEIISVDSVLDQYSVRRSW